MNDDQLQKEIERALAVEPSPQFVARVRQQVAAERQRRRYWWWKPVAVGMAAAVVVAIIVVYTPTGTPQRSLTSTAIATDVATPEPTPAPTPVAEVQRPRAIAVKPKASVPQRQEPEVLIDPREARAFRTFLDDVSEKRIDANKLEALFDAADKFRAVGIQPMPIAEIEPLVIPPVTSAPEKEGGSL